MLQHTPKFGIRHFILLQGYDRENPKSRRSGKFHRRQPESEKHLRPPMRNNGSSTACKYPSGPPRPATTRDRLEHVGRQQPHSRLMSFDLVWSPMKQSQRPNEVQLASWAKHPETTTSTDPGAGSLLSGWAIPDPKLPGPKSDEAYKLKTLAVEDSECSAPKAR